MIKRFIVWYLKRHNVMFRYESYVVRMFSNAYYERLMSYHDAITQLKNTRPNEKGGVE